MKKETNCLESLLCEFFNKGKKRKIFSKKVVRDEDGYVTKCFVKGGGEIYESFVVEAYRIGKTFKTIGDLEKFIASLKNIGFSSNHTFVDVIEGTDEMCGEN